MLTQQWNGASYDRISGIQQALGLAVLERLPLAGDELVIDAGCGSGRITQALLARLPRGRAIALDGSPSMVEAAAVRLAAETGPGGRVEIRVLDLLELAVSEPVDAILSTATFHWISDHPAAECWLSPAPATPEQPRELLATIVLGPHVQQLPQELREPFMDEVLQLLGDPLTIDYVRLNIDAVA